MRRTAFQGRAAWVEGCGGGGEGSGDDAGSSLCCHTTLGCAVSARRWPAMRPMEAETDPARPPAGSHACNTHTPTGVSVWQEIPSGVDCLTQFYPFQWGVELVIWMYI